MERILKASIALIVAFVLVLGGFVGGAVFERTQGGYFPPSSGEASADQGELPSLVGQVETIIEQQALKPSTEESMTAETLAGLLKSLDDPYAQYFSPDDFKQFQMSSAGEFFGVGMTLGAEDGTPTVVTVFKGTPAEKAGLKAGDIIVSVDGVKKKPWDLDDVVQRVRGPKGTKVVIEVRRDGVKGTLKFTVVRDRITIPNVMAVMIGKDVGHIRLMQFNEKTDTELRNAIEELDGKGAKGFILDLRGNPGGLLSVSVEVASLFIESGAIVRIEERGKPEVVENALGDTATDKPLVVLVDGNSASAAEIVAGALQDYGRATLVGEKTFGKGSVQTVLDLSNSGAVKLTTAHYLTPKKRVINKKGLSPDVVVEMDPKLMTDEKTDTQLKKAVEVLRKKF